MQAAFEKFIQGMNQGVAQAKLSALWNLQLPKAQPLTQHRLWQSYLGARFGLVSELGDLTLALSQMGSYASPAKLAGLIAASPLQILSQSEQEALAQHCMALLAEQEDWISGGKTQQLCETPHQSLPPLKERLGFSKSFDLGRFLFDLGLPFPACWEAHRAFERFVGQRVHYLAWQELLHQQGQSLEGLRALEFRLRLLFTPNLLVPLTWCKAQPDCPACPLQAPCAFYQTHQHPNETAHTERQLALDQPQLNTKDLLCYLTKPDFSATPFQLEVIERFPDLRGIPAQADSRSEENQKFFLKAKALASLLRQHARQNHLSLGKSFQNAGQVFEHFRHTLALEPQESFYTLLLDQRFQIIQLEQISKGLLNQSLVHPREVFAQAIQLRAAQLILIHNHPSGNLNPSQADLEITLRLVEAGKIIGIEVIDHIIISSQGYCSFGERGMMKGK